MYISPYLKDVKHKLTTALVGGECELHGAELTTHALDSLQLPVGVRHGILGHLVIKNLWSGGLHVILSDLVLIVQPLSSFEVSEEHDKQAEEGLWEAKKTKLKRHVERWIDQMHRRYTGSAQAKKGGMFDSYLNAWTRELRIDVHRVHVMLEDLHSNDRRPFTLGVVIDSIKLKPNETQHMDCTASHDHGKPVDDHSVADVQSKSIVVENLRVYLNSGHIGDLPTQLGHIHSRIFKRAQAVWLKEKQQQHARERRMGAAGGRRRGRGSKSGTRDDGGDSSIQLRSNSMNASFGMGRDDEDDLYTDRDTLRESSGGGGGGTGTGGGGSSGGGSSLDSDDPGETLGALYHHFGPVVAAQFRLLRMPPMHEIEDSNLDSYVEYPNGPTGDVLRGLPHLRRCFPGGWKHGNVHMKTSHTSQQKKTDLGYGTSYFSTWSLLDDTRLDHIVKHIDGSNILGGVSGEIVFCENKGNIERHDDPPRKSITVHLPNKINLNLRYNQVRHLGT